MDRERILLVEDDLVVLKVLESKLLSAGYEVIAVPDANQAITAAKAQKPDLMVLDLTLVNDSGLNGILDGFALLRWLRYTVADTDFPVIIHTSDISPKVDQQASACKVFAVFRKGDSLNDLLAGVRKALDKHKARHQALAANTPGKTTT